ncbi:AMP-binding protein [Kitasatospora purpeofusca]|uniref:AMP-binding protein n=1 Tax=Kitasatospora purpeofusca TaxID=67352 RepID=UPI002A5A4BBE|nr:AMP-binding protein [Kitasatospora purpeofusca]MDY0814679.1 AMP-binding protein [Kitasatospora purpeofusca]
MTEALRAGPGGAVAGAADATHTGQVLAGLARDPGRVALRHGSRSLTAAECLAGVHRLARALRSTGLGRGDGVTLLAGNRPEALLVRLAANLIGCRVAMLPADLPVAEQIALAGSAGTDAFVFDPEGGGAKGYGAAGHGAAGHGAAGHGAAAGIAAALPSVRLLTLGPGPLGTDLTALAEPLSPAPVAPRFRPQDVMAIRFTGGSTGRPKGVSRRFARPPRPELIAGSVFLLCTALCHGGGTTADLALAAGGTVVLQDGFAAAEVLAAIERYRVTRVYLPPHLLYQVLDHPALARTDTGSLRRVTYTGCPAAPERLAEATRRLGRVLHQTYSLTECGPVTRLTPDEHLDPRLLTTAGRPLPDTGVRILDEHGRPLPTGGIGRIWVSTPTAMRGYWRDPGSTARVLRDGWLDTGDLGALDGAGYLTVAGRRDPMAIVDAHNVFPRDVEGPLLTHPAVREAVMFTTTDRDRLQHAHAAVTVAPGSGVTVAELRQWVRERGGPRCEPATILVLPDLPLSGTGKPDLGMLRALVPDPADPADPAVPPASPAPVTTASVTTAPGAHGPL